MRWWHGFPFVRQEKPKEVEISTGNKSTGAVTVGDGNHFWGTRRVLWSWEDRLPTQTPVTVGVTSNGKSERRQQQPEQQQKEQDMKTGRMREKHRKEKGRKTRGYLNKIETLEEAASNAEDYEKKRGRWWCSSRRVLVLRTQETRKGQTTDTACTEQLKRRPSNDLESLP